MCFIIPHIIGTDIIAEIIVAFINITTVSYTRIFLMSFLVAPTLCKILKYSYLSHKLAFIIFIVLAMPIVIIAIIMVLNNSSTMFI